MEDVSTVEPRKSPIVLAANRVAEGLVAFEKRKAEFIELKKEADGIKITTLEDKALIKRASEVRKKLKTARGEVEKEGKAMRDPLTSVNKEISAKEKELVDIISPAESALEAQEAWVKAEQAKIDQEADRKEQARIQARIDRLAAYGQAIDFTLLKGIDDNTFEETVERARIEWQKEQDDIAEKAIQADKDRLELIALRQKQQEAKDMRTQGRISLLESFGMEKSRTGGSYAYEGHIVLLMDIQEQEERDWEVIFAGAREGIEKAKVDAKEKEIKKELLQNRLARLKGWAYNGFTVSRPVDLAGGLAIFGSMEDLLKLSEETFEVFVNDNHLFLADLEDKKEQKRLKNLEDARLEGIGKSRREMMKKIDHVSDISNMELGGMIDDVWEDFYNDSLVIYTTKKKEAEDKAEKDRQQDLGEKQKYEEYVTALKAVSIPDFKSGQYRAKINPIKSFIKGLK